MDNVCISGNPFRHQMARHSSREDLKQTNLDDFPVRILANFEISRFPPFHFLNFYSFLCYFGRQRRPPRISLAAAGATKDHFGGILPLSDFSRSTNQEKEEGDEDQD